MTHQNRTRVDGDQKQEPPTGHSHHTRRRYLTTAGTLLIPALAGCSDGDTEDMDGGSEGGDGGEEGGSNDENGDEEAGEEGQDYAESGEAALEITDEELVIDEGEFSTDVYVEAIVENTGDGPSGDAEISVDWYNEAGDYLDNSSALLASLPAGETWEARPSFLGSGAEEVDDFDVTGEFDTEPKAVNPEGLELVDSELQVSDDEAVIRGTIENASGEEQSYVEVIATIYDDEGTILGDEWTNVTDLPEGETWQFDMTWLDRARSDRAAEIEVVVADSAF